MSRIPPPPPRYPTLADLERWDAKQRLPAQLPADKRLTSSIKEWQPATLVFSSGGENPLPPSQPVAIPPGGTVCIVVDPTSDIPSLGGSYGVSAPWGNQGGMVDLGIPIVYRGIAIPLPYGGQVAPTLSVNGTTRIFVDWHYGEPREWWVPLVVTSGETQLPLWSTDLIWTPSAPTVAMGGAWDSDVTIDVTPGQLVVLSATALALNIDTEGSAQVLVRCRR